MNTKLWVALGTLLHALGAQAQQPSRTPDPTDPSVAVPATVYQSTLTASAPVAQDTPSPDKAWRAANDTVAGQPGHAGHHSPEPAPNQEKPQRAAPAAAPKDPHKHD